MVDTNSKSVKAMVALIALLVGVLLTQGLAWIVVPILKIGLVVSAIWVVVEMFR
jgi:hypothetical protein